MSIFSTLKFIINHPINRNNRIQSVLRFAKWQINAILNPYPIIYQFTDKCRLIIRKGMTGATGNLYCGLHDYYDMGFLLHFLRDQDLFIDIGANVGSYTILASGHVGSKTISFEPIPSTFENLRNNIAINQVQGKRVITHNIALGSKKGETKFTTSLDTMNHVSKDENEISIQIRVETLDKMLLDQPSPILLKIDVEGFETEVIKGATKTLADNGLKAVIIELNGSGSKYGFEEKTIHQTFIALGFKAFMYQPDLRKLSIVTSYGELNTIYIRDLNFVESRLNSADKIKIYNKCF